MLNNPESTLSIEDTAQQEQLKIDPDGNTISSTLPTEVVDRRAAVYKVAGSTLDPQIIKDSIVSGREENLRHNLSIDKSLEWERSKQDLLHNYVSEKAKSGGEVTPEEVDFFQTLPMVKPNEDIRTVVERHYAKKFVTSVLTLADNPQLNDALEETPLETHTAMNAATDVIAKRQVAYKKYEDLEARWKEENPFAKVGSYALELVPFWHSFATRKSTTAIPSSSGIVGENLEQQYEYLLYSNVEDFEQRFNTAVDNIYSKYGGAEAFRFIEGYLNWSNSSKAHENIGLGLEAAGIIPFGMIGRVTKLIKTSKKIDQVAETLRVTGKNSVTTATGDRAALDVLKSNLSNVLKTDKPNPKLSELADAVGDSEKSIPLGAVENVALKERALSEPPGPSELGRESLRSSLPPIFQDVKGTFSKGAQLVDEAKNAVVHALNDTKSLLESALGSTSLNAIRLNREAMLVAAREEWAKIKGTNRPNLPVNAPIFNPRFEQENLARVNTIDFYLGNEHGVGFPDAKAAQTVGSMWYRLPKDSFKPIEGPGGKWFIQISRNVDETNPAVRDALLDTGNNRVPNIRGRILGDLFTPLTARIKTPGEVMPTNVMGNALAAQHGVVNLEQAIKSVYQSITKDATRKELKDLHRVLEANMSYYNPVTNKTGAYYTTIVDFENEFKNIVGYYPSKGQVAAYFKTVALDEFSQTIKQLNAFRDLARQGAQNVTLKYIDGNGKLLTTPQFLGKTVDSLPLKANHDVSILVHEGKNVKVLHSRNLSLQDEAYINQTIKQGGKIVQLGHSHEKILKDIFGVSGNVDFIVSKTVTSSPVSLPKFSFEAGGPRIYKQEWAVKQPLIYRSNWGGVYANIYRGDKTLFLQGSEAEVRRVAREITEAKNVLKQTFGLNPTKTARDLTAFLRSRGLPWTTSAQFKRWIIDNEISLDHDFFPTRINQHSIETPDGRTSFGNMTGLRDTTKSPYAFAQRVEQDWAHETAPRFNTIRGMDPGNPIMNIEPAQYVDPIASLQRTLAEAANSRFWTNYQYHAAETWVQQFRHLLKQDEFTVRANPIAALINASHDGAFIGRTEATHSVDIAMAKATRANILNILGRKTKSQEFIDGVKAKVLNSVFNMRGQETADMVDWLISKRFKDPVHTIRAFSFYSRFFFDPSQLLKQGTTLFHTLAMDPKNGYHGFHAGNLFLLARANPGDAKYIAHLDDLAVRFGFGKSGDFTESWNTFLKTGLKHIEGEHIFRDPLETPIISKDDINERLGWSLVFFKAPERYTRMVAWNTAYRAWRTANPNAELDNFAVNSILTRQSDLTVNMTNAYRNSFSRGLLSIPTQFWSYNTHLFEQIWGKRLTAGEKTRLLGMYSLLYGIPTGGSVATLMPIYSQIKRIGQENGVDMDDTKIKMLTEGVINVGLQAVFGEKVNANTTFGPQGIFSLGNLVQGAVRQDKEAMGDALLDIIFGASGSTARTLIGALQNDTLGDIALFVSGDEEGHKSFEPLKEDILELANSVRVLSQADKIVMAINTNSWMQRKGGISTTLKDEVTTPQAIFYAITGLQPQEVEDAYFKIDSIQIRDNLIKSKGKDIINYFKRGLQAENEQDREIWWRKANALAVMLDLTPNKRVEFFRDAMKNDESLVRSVNENFTRGRNVPVDQGQARFEQMLRQGNK